VTKEVRARSPDDEMEPATWKAIFQVCLVLSGWNGALGDYKEEKREYPVCEHSVDILWSEMLPITGGSLASPGKPSGSGKNQEENEQMVFKYRHMYTPPFENFLRNVSSIFDGS